MSDWNDLMMFNKMHEKTPTKCTLVEYPTGRWGFRGLVPMSLTKEYVSGFTKGIRSKTFETREEAETALADVIAGAK